jgi:uncharacterized protein (TIGR03067 family)
MKSISLHYALSALVVLLAAESFAAADPAKDLSGTWEVVGAKVNGKAVEDRQISGLKLTFGDDSLLMEPGDSSQRERHKIKLEAGSEPSAYYSERVEPANRPQTGWTIFEVKGDRLRMAFFDALKGRPKSFDPQPKLLVLDLKKVPDSPAP